MRFPAALCLLVLAALAAAACANGQTGGEDRPDSGVDPTGDGGVDPTGDGGADGPSAPVTCGGTVCVAGQACNAGVCTFGCAGNSVPGDYATIQTAVDALAATGQDATICLGGATFTESTIFIRDTAAHGKTLQIIGESADRSTINAEVYVLAGWSSVTFRGVHISVPSNRTALRSQIQSGGSVKVLASRLSGQTGLDAYQRHDLLVDGTEIIAAGGYGVSLFANNSGPLTARIENSYLHGPGYMVRATTSSGMTVKLDFVNNTVVGPQVGLDLSGATTALIADSLFTGATSFAMQWQAGTTVTRQNNALWANATNYGGIASDGPGYLKLDCLLDTAGRIPSLRAGSPCRNAADPAVASSHDFHGALRGGAPDIGAVEAP